MAYEVQDAQISGPQDLLNNPKFDVEAKLDPSYVSALHQQTSNGKDFAAQAMLQSILVDRFKLVTHFETRTLPAYELLVDEGGSKLQPSANEPHMMRLGRGELQTSGSPLELLTTQLSARLGRPVVDKTGLKGIYAFNLHWTPDPSEDEHLKESGQPAFMEPAPDSTGPSLLTAVQEQLGLKLQPQTESVQVLVIDHVAVPSEN
jgi:uncharacterized protein (TIGR03435 family)